MQDVILLVDDEEMVLNALARVLNEDNYTILKTTSPKEALRLLEKYDVHVLISDQRMPEMTGCELLKQVKKDFSQTVTMIISGYADFEAVKESINEGHIYKFISKPWDNSYLKDQIREAVKYGKFQRMVEQELQKIQLTDKLTGLPNRAAFMQKIMNLEERSREQNYFIALLLIDIDRFGSINNRFGQHIGDQVLQALSDQLLSSLPPHGYLARIGNDEFVVMLDQIMHVSQVKPVVQELENMLKNPIMVSEREVYVTSSIGVALYPQDSERADVLVEKSHIALNFGKKIGGGLVQFYDPEMEKQTDVNILLETEIHHAVENDELVNFYQPVVSFESGKIIGAESLVRWQHPRRGLLAPLQFMPLCEQSGLIIPIDKSVLKKAIADLKEFSLQNEKDYYISSNFSIRHFMSIGLLESIQKMIRENGVLPHHIVIEVTESLLAHDSKMLLDVLQSLHNLGVRLALDDFGTGYASLSYLKKYPFDILKIDRSYIREIGRSKNDEVLISAMINMAKSMGQKVIAEGIESKKQIDFLKAAGCDYAQGFLLSHPIPKAEFVKKMSTKEFTKSIEKLIKS